MAASAAVRSSAVCGSPNRTRQLPRQRARWVSLRARYGRSSLAGPWPISLAALSRAVRQVDSCSCRCGHLGFGRAEPAADLVRDGGVGLVVGGADHGECFGRAVQVEQDVGLLPGGEGEQAGVTCFAGGGGGALEVFPGAGQAAHVDGLPSGQGGGVGQDRGELLAVPGAQGVAQAGLDVADVGFELGCSSCGGSV